ncbi:hypothetical protein P8452_31356 [Trifolium repens]|nr:hypothetical protein P8452_31356 [Trifolium repens]
MICSRSCHESTKLQTKVSLIEAHNSLLMNLEDKHQQHLHLKEDEFSSLDFISGNFGTSQQHVPTEIAKNCLKPNQNVITLVEDNSDKLYPCQICYYKSHQSKLSYIEQGFKEFFRDAELNVGDKLRLTV